MKNPSLSTQINEINDKLTQLESEEISIESSIAIYADTLAQIKVLTETLTQLTSTMSELENEQEKISNNLTNSS